MADRPNSRTPDMVMDAASLYREEIYTDRTAATLRVMVPVKTDGSTDGSYRELVRLHAAHLNVRVVRLRRNFGKAAALAAGIEIAAGEFVVTMDADLQDDPAEIPNLLAKLDDGYDVVSGWKCDRHDPFVRRFVSRIYNTATRLATGVGVVGLAMLTTYMTEPRSFTTCGSTANATASCPCSPTISASASPSCRSITAPARAVVRGSGSSVTFAPHSTSSQSSSWAATATGRFTCSAGWA